MPDKQQIKKAKLQSIAMLIMLIIGIATSLYFFLQLQTTNNELEETKQMLIEKDKHLEMYRDSLVQIVEEMSVDPSPPDDEHSHTEVLSPRSPIKQKSYDRIIKASKNAHYFLGFYAFNVPPEKYELAQKYILNEGYTVFADDLLEERQSWLATSATILYYDEKNSDKAKQIADDLEAITNQSFSTQIGAGLGVPKGLENQYFYIHFVK